MANIFDGIDPKSKKPVLDRFDDFTNHPDGNERSAAGRFFYDMFRLHFDDASSAMVTKVDPQQQINRRDSLSFLIEGMTDPDATSAQRQKHGRVLKQIFGFMPRATYGEIMGLLAEKLTPALHSDMPDDIKMEIRVMAARAVESHDFDTRAPVQQIITYGNRVTMAALTSQAQPLRFAV